MRVASSANLRGKNWGVTVSVDDASSNGDRDVSVGDASPTVRFPQDFHLFVWVGRLAAMLRV